MASSFSTLRQRGYGTIYAVKIEGIPFLLTEGPAPLRVESEATPGVPTGYTHSAAFSVVEETTIDQEIDREACVARGKSLDILLSWDVMEAEGILDALFRRPAHQAALAADVTATATTIEVDDASSFAASGSIYLGRELIDYGSISGGDTFNVTARGELGYAYTFRAADPGSHALVTPTPLAWRGRFVTIYEHLLSPEGRILDSTWTEGSYRRELWKGYLDSPPIPGKLGMMLRALPIVRLGAQELGSSLEAKTIGLESDSGANPLDYPIYVEEGAAIDFTFRTISADAGDWVLVSAPTVKTGASGADELEPGAMTIRRFCEAAAAGVVAGLSSHATLEAFTLDETVGAVFDASITPDVRFLVSISDQDGDSFIGLDIHPNAGVYWALSKAAQPTPPPGLGGSFGTQTTPALMPVMLGVKPTPYLAVRDITGGGGADFTLPAAGRGVVKTSSPWGGDTREVIRWDSKITTDSDGEAMAPRALLHIAERGLALTSTSASEPVANLRFDGTLEVVAGDVGQLNDVAQTMLESSGTGLRGSFDTLALGFGLGIPGAWIDLEGTGSAPLTTQTLPLLAMGQASWGALFSGWYGLSSLCLAARRNSAGVIQLMLTSTSVAHVISTAGASHLGTELGKGDVVVGGTEVPRLVVGPNKVMIDTSAGPYESDQIVFNAVGRIQTEGVHPLELGAPGANVEMVTPAVLSIMARGDGQSVIEFAVAPWVAIELGDPVTVTVAHPVLYDWSDGTRQPASVAGRVVGQSMSMHTGAQRLTILLDGLLEPGNWLCPSPLVASVAGDNITLGTDGGAWFRDGETVRVYNEGAGGSELWQQTVTSIAGDVLTMASTPPGWVASGTVVTYPLYISGSTEQTGAFMYVRPDKRWH